MTAHGACSFYVDLAGPMHLSSDALLCVRRQVLSFPADKKVDDASAAERRLAL
jgi:hypothetical protein